MTPSNAELFGRASWTLSPLTSPASRSFGCTTLFLGTGPFKLMIGGTALGVLRSRLPLTVLTRPF
jgi:hypothetical protein